MSALGKEEAGSEFFYSSPLVILIFQKKKKMKKKRNALWFWFTILFPGDRLLYLCSLCLRVLLQGGTPRGD